MTAEETENTHRDIVHGLLAAAQQTGRCFQVISRSDSTLRGHYPLETDVLAEALGIAHGKELFIPYFREGERYTVDDIHFLYTGDEMLPVGESEFSRDKTFGYHASDLKEWIAEKTKGAYPAEQVASISLAMPRGLDIEGMLAVLRDAGKRKVVVNATCDEDLRVFAIAYLRATAEGIPFLARTAAAWPRVIGDVPPAPLLGREALVQKDIHTGGLVVVGSHVHRTSEQLTALQKRLPTLCYLELDQHLALDEKAFAAEVKRVAGQAGRAIGQGETAVVFTRRERLDLPDASPEEQLRITQRIADGVTRVVRCVQVQPRFVIAKGGITSSDIAVKALGAQEAMILGQVLPGVPVWRLEAGSRYPGMSYIVFPGNVGGPEALAQVVATLMEAPETDSLH